MKTPALPNQVIGLIVFVVSAVILCADFYTGPDIRFTILYVIPVAYAAWRWRFSMAFLLALTMPLFRLSFAFTWDSLPTPSAVAINTSIQWATLIGIAALISRMVTLQKRINVLEGILPICAFCKKIRGPEEKWEAIEDYIAKRSEAHFTHTFCPTCARQHYPEAFQQVHGP